LEGTFRGHLAQAPCSEQGHLQLDRFLQVYALPAVTFMLSQPHKWVTGFREWTSIKEYTSLWMVKWWCVNAGPI